MRHRQCHQRNDPIIPADPRTPLVAVPARTAPITRTTGDDWNVNNAKGERRFRSFDPLTPDGHLVRAGDGCRVSELAGPGAITAAAFRQAHPEIDAA